jgi:uncharacterized iron-regulated membrane protein
MPLLLRRVVFWLHLLTGLGAGTIVLVMAVTGALLAFEPQIVERAERDLWTTTPPSPVSPRLPLAALVTRAEDLRGGERATTVSFRAHPHSTIRIGFGRDSVLFMHPSTGAAVGSARRPTM